MIAVILCSIFVGISITLIAQVIFLRKWFFSLPIEGPQWKPQTERYSLPKELKEVLRDPDLRNKKEACVALNLLFQFLFREIKDTQLMRRWVMQRMQMEFTDMLQTTTGKLLDQITVREFNLGETFPFVKSASVNNVVIKEENLMEELTLLVDLTYNGGFQLAIDVNMMFGKSAFLSVKVTKIQGMARLQFSRIPYTHWSFAFIEDPIMEFDVKSHFEGRPMPQITSLIMNQIRRVVRKKHTLPNYKIRYKPFFRKPEPKPLPKDVYIHDRKMSQGRMEVTVIECNRLVMLSSDEYLYVTLALDSVPWKDVVNIRQKLWVSHEAEVTKDSSASIGLTFREEFVLGRFEEMVAIEAVDPNTPAGLADLRKNDIIVSIGGVKVANSKHATKLIKQSGERFVVKVERSSSLKPAGQPRGVPATTGTAMSDQLKVEENTVTFKHEKNESAKTTDSEDYVNITLATPTAVDAVSRESTSSDDLSVNSSPKKGFSILSGSAGLFHRKRGKDGSGGSLRGSPEVKEKVEHRLDQGQVHKTMSSPAFNSSERTEDVSDSQDDSKVNTLPVRDEEPNLTNTPVTTPKACTSSTAAPASSTSSSSQSTSKPPSNTDSFDLRTSQFVKASQDPIFKESFGFDVRENHAYLHVCVWCRIPEKLDKQQRVIRPEKDILLGFVCLSLMQTALECVSTIQGDMQQTYKLKPGNAKPNRSKIASHPGFDEQLCYGDITLGFKHIHADITNEERKTINRVKEENEKAAQDVKVPLPEPSNVIKRKSLPKSVMEGKHDFISAHFQAVTYCNFCHKKIWLKTAFQCCVCAMVCHKKCTEKCQAQTKCTKGSFHQKELKPTQKVPLNNKENIPKDPTDTAPSTSPVAPLRSGFLSKLRGRDGSPKAFSTGKSLRPKLLVRTASPEPPTDRKRHNSVPDVDKDLIERSTEERAAGMGHKLSTGGGGTETGSLPRTRSSSTLEDLIKQNASPSMTSTHFSQNSGSESTSSADSTDTDDDDDELNLLKFYERQKAACSQNADELVVTAAKEMGRELYANLSPEQRREKLDNMICKLQQEIDQESEHRAELARLERELTSPIQKSNARIKIEKSDEKIQSLALLMLHYCAGLQHCMEQRELEDDRELQGQDNDLDLQAQNESAEIGYSVGMNKADTLNKGLAQDLEFLSFNNCEDDDCIEDSEVGRLAADTVSNGSISETNALINNQLSENVSHEQVADSF